MWVYIHVRLHIRIYTHIQSTSEAEAGFERRFQTGTRVSEPLSLSFIKCHLLSRSLFKYPARILQSREAFYFYFLFRGSISPPFHRFIVCLLSYQHRHRACVLIHRHAHKRRHSCLQTYRNRYLPPRMLGRRTYYYYYYYYITITSTIIYACGIRGGGVHRERERERERARARACEREGEREECLRYRRWSRFELR
jgi:hypothetical protein